MAKALESSHEGEQQKENKIASQKNTSDFSNITNKDKIERMRSQHKNTQTS